MAFKKKAQSALEFLTTYGWAFLVILIMIGALSYFGVLDPSKFLPDKCLFGAGIGACQDFTVQINTGSTTSNVLFRITNNFGSTINLNTGSVVSITGISNSCAVSLANLVYGTGSVANSSIIAATAPTTWNASQSLLFNLSGCTIGIGERPTVSVTLSFNASGQTYPRSVDGTISVKRTQ